MYLEKGLGIIDWPYFLPTHFESTNKLRVFRSSALGGLLSASNGGRRLELIGDCACVLLSLKQPSSTSSGDHGEVALASFLS